MLPEHLPDDKSIRSAKEDLFWEFNGFSDNRSDRFGKNG
jgi:hypothetical protein